MRVTPCVSIATALLLACGHTSPTEPPPAQASRPETETVAPITAASAEASAAALPSAEPARENAEPAAPGRLYYALAQHPARAELWQGEVRVLDLGELSGAQYTLGGWLTGAGANHAFGEAHALLVPGKVLKVALPAAHTGASRLSMRVRGLAAGPLSLHVNGERLADVQLTGKDFEDFTFTVPAERIKRGENTLQLRAAKSGASPKGGSASLAIDWLRFGPEAAPHETSDPPSLAQLAPREGEVASLRIPAGMGLGYSLEVPEHGELRARVKVDAGATLTLVAERDGAPPEPLTAPLRGESELRVPLARFAGHVVRLMLRAEAGNAELRAPEVVVVEHTNAATAAGDVPAAKPIRNVVIVLVDTLRADKLSPYSPNTRVKTPGLSTLLQTAAVMQNARTQENWTKPSVATLLSSLLPWQHKAYTDTAVVPASVQLAPELLRERGFYTGAFIANGYVSDKFGFKQGWHTYRNYIREGRRTIAQAVAADVVEWLDTRPKDKPFFLYVHTIDPHVPYKPPTSFLKMYDDDDSYAGPVDFSQTNELLEKIKIGSLKLNARDKVRLEALYDAEISYHDVHFAATLRALEERGLSDETMIVVTADHGEEFWDHGSVGHGHSVYDELLHVPMIMRIPGVTEAKQKLPDAVGLLDVMPTVLDAIGETIPEEMAGRSFLPELRGKGSSAPRTAVSGFMTGWRTLGVGRLKLIQRSTENMFLYDVAEDPHEARDLAAERPIALRYARSLLGITLAEKEAPSFEAKPRREHREESTKIDAATEAQLRALGYVGSSRP